MLLSVGGPSPGRVLDAGDAARRAAFESVFLGTVRLMRDLAPHIADGGAILSILAISAKEASPILPISNGPRPGLAKLTKNFAVELGPRAIRVNALLPDLFGTERLKRLIGDAPAPVEAIALNRWAARPNSAAWRRSCCRRSPPMSPAPRCPSTAAS